MKSIIIGGQKINDGDIIFGIGYYDHIVVAPLIWIEKKHDGFMVEGWYVGYWKEDKGNISSIKSFNKVIRLGSADEFKEIKFIYDDDWDEELEDEDGNTN
jgi:hypothetical protein